MQTDKFAVDFFGEEHMIFVIFTYHQRSNAFPVAQVGAFGKHRGDAAAQMSGWKPRVGSVAVGSVSHIENPVDLSDAGIFDASGVKIVLRREHWFGITSEMDAIRRMGITQPADPIESLCAVEHVKFTLVKDHCRVKDVVSLPA